MEIQTLNEQNFSEKRLHLFYNPLENEDKTIPQLLTLFLSTPDENLSKLQHIFSGEKTLEYSYDKYNAFPEEYLNKFNELTRKSDKEIHYFQTEMSFENGLYYINLDYFLKIPSYYEEDITKIIMNNPQTQEEFIEDAFKVNTFSFDLISNIVGIFNSSCKTASIHSSKERAATTLFFEIDPDSTYKVLHRFKSESLVMRKTIVFLKTGKWLDRIKGLLRVCFEEMCVLRTVFMQILLEMAAFQFVGYLQIPKILLQEEKFFFLKETEVKELSKENCEEIDSDIRDYWLETIEIEARSLIKQLNA